MSITVQKSDFLTPGYSNYTKTVSPVKPSKPKTIRQKIHIVVAVAVPVGGAGILATMHIAERIAVKKQLKTVVKNFGEGIGLFAKNILKPFSTKDRLSILTDFNNASKEKDLLNPKKLLMSHINAKMISNAKKSSKLEPNSSKELLGETIADVSTMDVLGHVDIFHGIGDLF